MRNSTENSDAMQWRAEKRAATTAGVPTAKLNQHATAQHVITAKAIKLGQKTPKTTGKLGKRNVHVSAKDSVQFHSVYPR
jgi:hypothetical protein